MAIIELRFNLVLKDIAAPAVLDRRSCVPEPLRFVGDAVEKQNVLAPRQLCNNLLHNCGISPFLGEFPHIFQISRGEPFDVRELRMKIGGELIDDAGTPAMGGLALENLSPNPPVKQDQFAVDGEGSTMPGLLDLALQVA